MGSIKVANPAGGEELVPVILMPEGKVEYFPASCVEILKLVRTMDANARARFDRLLKALGEGAYTAADLRSWTGEQACAVADSLA